MFYAHRAYRLIFLVLTFYSSLCFCNANPPLQTPPTQDSIIVSYKGNMGVLVTCPKVSVLIDGLHEYYAPAYLNPPAEEVSKMISGQDGYNQLQFAIFTHFHRDHYSAKLAKDFLRSSAKNRVAGSPQVTDSLPAAQVMRAWNKNTLLFDHSTSNLSIYAFDIPHTGPQRHSKVQNIAYVVRSGELNLLHIGDADTDPSAFRKLSLGKVDVLVVPIWFLMNKEGREIIQDIIKPHTVIATHISPGQQNAARQYQLAGTPIHFFTVINQAVTIKR